jgi:hypothetical protein
LMAANNGMTNDHIHQRHHLGFAKGRQIRSRI